MAVGLWFIALVFAWSIGAHYTGACMGMPYGSGSIRLEPALRLMALGALGGAFIASHPVEITVGWHIIPSSAVTLAGASSILLAALLLTTIYTAVKIPTSTIQILVFSVVGFGLATNLPVHWHTIETLALVWLLAPMLATLLGYVLTRIFDAIPALPAGSQRLLIVMGVAASFTMGANDVANATGLLLMTHEATVWTAGLVGGLGLVLGILTWGRPLLQKVAFDVVHVDRTMATAAQGGQALIVLIFALNGYFTSMNQALIGAMAGTGMARGWQTVEWTTLGNILKGWLIGPPSGMALAFLVTKVLGIWLRMS